MSSTTSAVLLGNTLMLPLVPAGTMAALDLMRRSRELRAGEAGGGGTAEGTGLIAGVHHAAGRHRHEPQWRYLRHRNGHSPDAQRGASGCPAIWQGGVVDRSTANP